MARNRFFPKAKPTERRAGFRPQLVCLEDRVVPAFVIRTGAADDAAGITTFRDQFRADLGGGTTAGANGSFGGVRREINWDGVPAAKSAPNLLPADFFNTTSPRGAVFSPVNTGTGFAVSGSTADAGTGQPALEFSDLNATYPTLFNAFSPQRLFTPLDSTSMDVSFFLPGTTTAATVNGFGVIFSDVDLAGVTAVEFDDANGNQIAFVNAPPSPTAANGGFSFVGGFDDTGRASVASVRIFYGNTVVGGAETATNDVVVADDFLYGEPRVNQTTGYALSGSTLFSFGTANPTAATSVAITGVTAGESLVGIDVRPQNGQLYALGVNATANTATLYAVSARTGVAGVVGTAGSVAFTTDGATVVDFPDPATTAYDIDFNPTVDRVRVVAGGLNFRLDPNTGLGVDGDNTGLTSGTVTGTNPDGAINGGTTTLNGVAYTNSAQNAAVTTLYTIDTATESLYIQNPANVGTQSMGVPLTLGGVAAVTDDIAGFDLAGVTVAASNTPAVGSGFVVATVGGVTNLYSVNLATGALTAVGKIADGSAVIDSFTLQPEQGGLASVGLSTDGTTLTRFSTGTPLTGITNTITNLTAGETVVGIDYRPQTGQLFALGVNATANTATLYRLDPQSAKATVIGAASSIAFVDAAGNPVDFPDVTAGYGIDFNPTVDRLRVVTGTGLNFRVNPLNGLAVDGDLGGAAGSVTGTNTDGLINGLPGGGTGVVATAYTNNFGQTLGVSGPTTQYTLDPTSNMLFIQNPPNAGTQTKGVAVTLGGNPLDFDAVGGFDIPAGVRVATSAAVAAGIGYAYLDVGGGLNLYAIDLTTGVATDLGTTVTGFSDVTVGDAPAGVVSAATASLSVSESKTSIALTVVRTGGTAGAASVTVTLASGTATAGADFTGTPIILTFADGVATATATIPILADTLVEGTETFTATLSAPTGGIVIGGPATTTIAILDDEALPTSAVAYALAGGSLITLDTANPANALAPVAITGLTAGDALVGIDVRPQNGQLYGLGYNGAAGTVQVYAISPRTGVATPVGSNTGFVDAANNPVRIGVDAATTFGFDFNPTVDRIRVVTSNGQNFRLNPNTGGVVDGNAGAAGNQMDGAISTGTTSVDGTAYTNSAASVTVTTQYTLDAATDKLFIQNPPNNGTQTAGLAVTVGGKALDFSAVGGFDIPALVNAVSSNAAVPAGFGYAALTVGGVNQLYRIDLPTGAATLVGTIRDGATAIGGFAVANDFGGLPSVALTAAGTKLLRISTTTAATPVTVTISGVTAGETLVGIDYRPATGQLIGLGINATANTGTLYVIDPQGGAATVIGTASQIAFVDAAAAAVDFPDPATAGYGFDFNPTVDRIRVTTSTGLNFRLNPITGAAVDGDLNMGAGAVAGVNTDALINGATGASGAAYTNSFGQPLTGGVTTLYTIDATTDTLFIQNPPNAGTQSKGVAVTLGGAPLDFTDVGAFDIPSGVTVLASNAPAGGTGYAVLTVGTVTGLYAIDLATGQATSLGTVGDGTAAVAGLALGDTPAGVVTFTAPTFSKAENGVTADLTLTRSSGVGAVTVTIMLTSGTAAAGTDFVGTPVTVTFADGQTTATASVPLTDDAIFEADETFTATVTGLTGAAALGAISASVVTITNDDAAPTVSVGNAGVTEGNAGTTTATFIVTLSAASSTPVTVDFSTTNGTALSGSDYVPAAGTLTFAPGETSMMISVTVNGDLLNEADETFTVTLANPTGATLAVPATGTGTITNDDAVPTLSIGNVTVLEGNTGSSTASFTVTLSAASGQAVTVDFATADGTATAGSDYTTGKGTLTFAPGETTKTVMVTVAGDTTAEGNETFTVTLTNPTAATIMTATGTGTITNDDGGPTLSISDAKVTEGNAGTATATFTVTLSAASGQPVTVLFATTDGTATAGTDFVTTAGTLTFAPGETTKTVTVTVNGDALFETDETFTVSLAVPNGATILKGDGIGTITNDDTAPVVSIGNVTIAEGNVGTSTATFTITLSAVSGAPVTVSVASVDGTATAGSDFVALAKTTITIPAGMTSATVGIAVNGDTTTEPDETFTVTLSSPTGATLGTATGTATITNDDAVGGNTAPTITAINNQTTTTGVATAALTFTVADAQTTAASLTVTATSSNATLLPTAGIVLGGTGANRTLTLTPAAGQTGAATVTVTVSDGSLSTSTTFTLTVTGAPVVALVGVPPFAAGTDAGGNGTVTFFNPDKTVRFTTQPFGAFTGGVRTASGDVNGDGMPDVIVGTGPGRATQVIVIDGATQKQLFTVNPFEASFTGGVYVTVGDLNADGKADIIITPDEGGGPRVDVYAGSATGGTFAKLASFFGIDDANFRGGARAATGDVNGDGVTDLVVAAGFGGGPRVAAFNGKSIGGTPVKLFNDFFAFEQTLRNGVFITVGDLDADGKAELIAGGGPGGGPRVTAFSAANLISSQGGTLTQLANFFGGDPNSRGGIRVSVKNLDNDTRADIVVGAGANAGSRLTAYLGKTITPTGTPPATFDFDLQSGFTGGVFVG